jgi:hypothetical protein
MALSSEDGIDAGFCWRNLAYAEPERQLEHLLRAAQAYPSASAQLALAEYYRDHEQWKDCYSAAQQAIALVRIYAGKGAGHWSDDVRLRGPFLHDLAAVAGWNMWDFEAAYGHAIEAVRRDPAHDATRMQNLQIIQAKIKEGATATDLPPQRRPVMITRSVRTMIQARSGDTTMPIEPQQQLKNDICVKRSLTPAPFNQNVYEIITDERGTHQ